MGLKNNGIMHEAVLHPVRLGNSIGFIIPKKQARLDLNRTYKITITEVVFVEVKE